MEINNLPVFEFLIDDSEQSGVKTISLVQDPAIESHFIAFDNNEPKLKYVKFKEYEQVVFGIALQPDFPIYRNDNEIGQYYGVFTKETIKKIVHKFHREQQTSNVNLDHNDKKYIDAFMFSDYIVDSELQIEDLKNKGIPDAKIGSWIVAYKINDPSVFQKVISGEFLGFSVESFLDRALFSNTINKFKNKKEMKKHNKTLLEKIISLFVSENFERVLVPELGFEIEWTEVGQPVNQVIVDAEGNETLTPVGKGEFTTDLGIVVTDDASNLVEIRELPVEEVPIEEVPIEEPLETELPIEEPLAEGDPMVEPDAPVDPNEIPSTDGEPAPVPSLDVTISEIVGNKDGEYWILVKVVDGLITEAEVSSEVSLLNSQVTELKNENSILLAKMEEPITEPILSSVVEEKDYNKMSAYEKSMYRRGLNS